MVATAQVTPACWSSTAANGTHSRTGKLPTEPKRTEFALYFCQLGSSSRSSTGCESSRPSALQVLRRRCRIRFSGSSPLANGEIDPSVKLESISRVIGRLDSLTTAVRISAAPLAGVMVSVCS